VNPTVVEIAAPKPAVADTATVGTGV